MPAPQLHLFFSTTIASTPGIAPELQRACAAEPAYTRLGAIFHDLPYYGNMLVETVRYGLGGAALDEPWAYRMHSVRPDRFVASYLRAAAENQSLSPTEKLALVGGLLSHCALDLTLHPLVNYCARRDVARFGGHESVHHRLAEKYHALFFHLERLGEDPIGTPLMREWTRVTHEGSLVKAHVEAPLLAFMRDAYRGAYGGAPSTKTFAGWVRSFRHFGVLVGGQPARHNSKKVRRSTVFRERYFVNETFRFHDFYRCSERRLIELCNLGHRYFVDGDFSRDAEDAFVRAARIDDLAEPEPQPRDQLPSLPRLLPVCTPGETIPRVA